ncbi:MAG: enoyl-CoA hydratase/isomerase family protein [Rhodothermia bacterium]|nr:enoyl-CoA hydratase/isomerase family protein [Rhodothermia bacterium]
MAYGTLLLEVDDHGVALVTINRPDKLNALNAAVLGDLDQCFKDLEDDDQVRAIVITGSGRKAFVAGADISEFAGLAEEDATQLARRGQGVFDRIEQCRKPVLAAVNGFALGGGCELALACHIRIAAEDASFGQPEVNIGIIPGYGGTQRLSRVVGPGTAAEIILTGERISAQRGYEIGLVNRLATADGLIDEALRVAGRIASKAPLAVALALDAIRTSTNGGLEEGLEREAVLFGRTFATEDAAEGIGAFMEKRKPNFKGR